MNNTYKKGLLMSIIIHVVIYFPMKWLIMFIFTNAYLKNKFRNSSVGIYPKWGVHHYIFWAVLFGCLTSPLNHILSLLNYNTYIAYGNTIRICLIFASIFFIEKNMMIFILLLD